MVLYDLLQQHLLLRNMDDDLDVVHVVHVHGEYEGDEILLVAVVSVDHFHVGHVVAAVVVLFDYCQ